MINNNNNNNDNNNDDGNIEDNNWSTIHDYNVSKVQTWIFHLKRVNGSKRRFLVRCYDDIPLLLN